ncbi:uncharacterized protein LOC130370382 [Gadus chalcogrammus]|uniref:uncharacterized protein LOC130370382 n=1 Tax=Gadus chalcogrammus TaxID=1042646 RepID=UPI0024C4D9BB|nr:uncharacterized protein LOC130370382 [Gadus chalcogrammus]
MSNYIRVWDRAEPKYRGLRNRGSTDYLNSVLQVLFMTKEFRDAVQSPKNSFCHSESSHTSYIDADLKDLFRQLKTGSPTTEYIIRKLGIENVWKQQDAAEYFEKILSLASPGASQVFHGRLIHRTSCSCGASTNEHNSFWTLNLPINNAHNGVYNVEDGLKGFFSQSTLTGDNQVYCDECEVKRDTTTECEVELYPKVLVLLLKRFEFSYYIMDYVKNDCPVDVPLNIEMPKGVSYELYATVDHVGDLRGGHYTATIQPPDDGGCWYDFNDSMVTPKNNFNPERSQSGYLLFYRKRERQTSDPPQEHHHGSSVDPVESETNQNNADDGNADLTKRVDVRKGVDDPESVDVERGDDVRKGVDDPESVDVERGDDVRKGVDDPESVDVERGDDVRKGVDDPESVDVERGDDVRKGVDDPESVDVERGDDVRKGVDDPESVDVERGDDVRKGVDDPESVDVERGDDVRKGVDDPESVDVERGDDVWAGVDDPESVDVERGDDVRKGVDDPESVDVERGDDVRKGVDDPESVDVERGDDVRKGVDDPESVDVKRGDDVRKGVDDPESVDVERGDDVRKGVDDPESVDVERGDDVWKGVDVPEGGEVTGGDVVAGDPRTLESARLDGKGGERIKRDEELPTNKMESRKPGDQAGQQEASSTAPTVSDPEGVVTERRRGEEGQTEGGVIQKTDDGNADHDSDGDDHHSTPSSSEPMVKQPASAGSSDVTGGDDVMECGDVGAGDVVGPGDPLLRGMERLDRKGGERRTTGVEVPTNEKESREPGDQAVQQEASGTGPMVSGPEGGVNERRRGRRESMELMEVREEGETEGGPQPPGPRYQPPPALRIIRVGVLSLEYHQVPHFSPAPELTPVPEPCPEDIPVTKTAFHHILSL